jgi:ribosomal protein S18 acetylase RimI-like enzyme
MPISEGAVTVDYVGTDEERAVAFARWYDEQVCTRIEPWRFGTQYIDEDFPQESDTNFVLLGHVPPRTRAETVARATDAALADVGSPRRAVVDSIALADRLRVTFEADGWILQRHLLLVRDGHAQLRPGRDVHCEEVSLGSFLRFRSAFDAVTASRSYLEKVERRLGSRYFVATLGGRPASGCVLWAHEGDAQIDSVATAPPLRRCGAGAAVVTAAIQASEATWVHLYTEAATGPTAFYESLGFAIAGAIVECTRGS